MILAGAAADHYSPAWVIAISGTVGAAVALVIAVSWAGARRQSADGRLRGLRSAPAGVAHGVLLVSCGGLLPVGGVSPSRCRAWRAPYLVWRVVAGRWGQPQPVSRMACSVSGVAGCCRSVGSAPAGVAHDVLLPLSIHSASLGNQPNVPRRAVVQFRRGVEHSLQSWDPPSASRLPIVACNCVQRALCTYCRE
jgi:hypothetical protein